MVRAVDVAVERFGRDEVERVGSVLVIGHLNVVVADAVAHRTEVHHGLIFDELSAGDTVGGVPDVVDFALNAQLVAPGDAGGLVADELGVNVGRFGDPAVEGVLFDAVGARIAGRVGVDDAGGVHGHDAVVREAEEALRNLNFVGVDAFEDAFNHHENVVAQNGREGLVGAVHAVGFTRFGGHIAPRDGGRARAVFVGLEGGGKQDGLVGWPVVLHHGVGHRVLPDETDVLVGVTGFGVVGQKVGDGVVAVPLGVGGNVNGVGTVSGVQHGDGRFLSEEVRSEFTGDLVVRPPNPNLKRIFTGRRQDVVDGVVVQPVEVGLTGGCIELDGDDERRVDAAGDLKNGFVGLRPVEDEFRSLGAVAEQGRDGVVVRPVGSGFNREGHGVPGMGATLAVERVAAGFSGIAGVHFGEGREALEVDRVDGRSMAVEFVRGAEQAVEFLTARGNVFPGDEGGFRGVVEGRKDVLSLQVIGFTVCLHGAHGCQREKHDCGENHGAQTTVSFSLWATHHEICRLRPL